MASWNTGATYKKAKALLKSGKPFKLVNEYGEQKTFTPGDTFYRAKTLQLQFKMAYVLGETITIKEV